MTEREIFLEVLEMATPEERADYLQGACGRDVTLRRKVDELLKEHFSNDSLLAGPALKEERITSIESHVQDSRARTLGRYRLLEKIGEGGFGEVWMAEQHEPVKRCVALKIIKPGMDSHQVVARFEAERQALAMMDHVNIAKIFDAGVTDAGRPYFVMELVHGIRITDYCDQNQLSTRERLELFVKVCQAIQHAHQKGVIHRDIKPSNILVTLNDSVPVPKVIDFGIAKATQQELTDKTLFTQLSQFIGTPAYTSPEQAEMSGLDIDTRADVYSLGVLLYELLVGQTPFDAKEMMKDGIDALRQIIREKAPLRPSTRLNTLQEEDRTTAGKRRQTEVGKLVHQLQGDLDWIVMKCLEKDRTRRYETATGLGSDIQRHLNYEAVLARPASTAYRFQKLIQRNKLAFAAVTGVATALALGVVASTLQAIRATRAEREQSRQRDAAVTASANEVVQRKLAGIQLGLQAWEEGDLPRANELIEASRPATGESPSFEWRYLRKLCQDQSIKTFGSPGHQYRSAVFLGGDSLLLNDEKTLTLHDLSRGKEQLLLEDRDGIFRPSLCPGNPNILATATDDGRIKLWDLAAKRVTKELAGHPPSSTAAFGSPYKTIAFSGDGRWLVSALSDNFIKLWDLAAKDSQAARIVHQYSSWACDGAFTPDGRHLFSSGSETVIRTWDVATGAEEGTPLKGHTSWVYALALSPDGRWLASGGTDSTIIIWDVLSGKMVTRHFGHVASVTSLAISPDSQILASGNTDHTIRLWDLHTGKQVSMLRGHQETIFGLNFSPDGKLLASRSRDGLIKLWRVVPGLEADTLTRDPHGLSDVALSQDGQCLAFAGGLNFTVELWNLPARSRTLLNGHTDEVVAMAFSPDGKTLATGSHDQTVRLWDVSNHTTVAALANRFPVGSLAFSPDGSTLVAGGSKHYFRVGGKAGLQFWDVPSRQATGTISGDASDIVSVAWSASGSKLATGHKDGSVSLWDAETRRLLHRFASQFGEAMISLAFSPTEPLLAAGDWWGGNIVLYNTATNEVLLPPLKGHIWHVSALVFSPDGRTLASSGEGGGLKLWHVASRQLALTLHDHGGPVRGIAFSRDGNLMASCGVDGTVRLWPAATVEEADAATKTKTR